MNKVTRPLETQGVRECQVSGSFAPNLAGAVASSSVKGAGFTVARTGVGVFEVTLNDKWRDAKSIVASLEQTTRGDQLVATSPYNVSTRKFTITVWDVSSAALVDTLDNTNRINFQAIMDNRVL